MTIKKYQVGEGVLTVGSAVAAQTMTAQMESVHIEWKEDAKDPRKTLSGESLPGAVTYTATLTGTVIQDLSDGGLVEWTWEHMGSTQPFTFSPASATGREITGDLRVGPLDVGGDVDEDAPTSDLSWACIGQPVLGAALVGP